MQPEDSPHLQNDGPQAASARRAPVTRSAEEQALLAARMARLRARKAELAARKKVEQSAQARDSNGESENGPVAHYESNPQHDAQARNSTTDAVGSQFNFKPDVPQASPQPIRPLVSHFEREPIQRPPIPRQQVSHHPQASSAERESLADRARAANARKLQDEEAERERRMETLSEDDYDHVHRTTANISRPVGRFSEVSAPSHGASDDAVGSDQDRLSIVLMRLGIAAALVWATYTLYNSSYFASEVEEEKKPDENMRVDEEYYEQDGLSSCIPHQTENQSEPDSYHQQPPQSSNSIGLSENPNSPPVNWVTWQKSVGPTFLAKRGGQS